MYLHQGGRYEAVSALYHFRHRDHAPALGRWVQRDPLGYAAGDANLYRYLGNGPAHATDPSGLFFWDAVKGKDWDRDIQDRWRQAGPNSFLGTRVDGPYRGPDAVAQVDQLLAARARVVANGGTVTPLMAGSVKVYGSDGNQNIAGAMVEAGHHIMHMSGQALVAGLTVLPPVRVAVTVASVAVPLIQGDYESAAKAGIFMALVGGLAGLRASPCTPRTAPRSNVPPATPRYVVNSGTPPGMPSYTALSNPGRRVTGLLIFQERGQTRYIRLTSGVNNATNAGLAGARNLPGATSANWHHVEFQSSEIMRQRGITNASLLHNYPTGLPCNACMPGGDLTRLQSSLATGNQLSIFGLVPSPPGSTRSPWMVSPAGSVRVSGTW